MVLERSSIEPSVQTWLALVIGNSRLHWARFRNDELQHTWDTAHLSLTAHSSLPVWIASVVPAQTKLWETDANVRFLSLKDVPLQGLYPTLGIDRALALWGAIVTLGSPALVIDAGTALTFTGADANHQLVGGAILPGLRLQFESLGQHTAALPLLHSPLSTPHCLLPPYWALDTQTAIASGILHTLAAGLYSFIQDWWRQFPHSAIVLTGGDSDQFYALLNHQFPELSSQIIVDPQVIFKGIQAIAQKQLNFA